MSENTALIAKLRDHIKWCTAGGGGCVKAGDALEQAETEISDLKLTLAEWSRDDANELALFNQKLAEQAATIYFEQGQNQQLRIMSRAMDKRISEQAAIINAVRESPQFSLPGFGSAPASGPLFDALTVLAILSPANAIPPTPQG